MKETKMSRPTLEFTCPYCGQNLEVTIDLIGKEIECGACCNDIEVPSGPDGWEGDLVNQL